MTSGIKYWIQFFPYEKLIHLVKVAAELKLAEIKKRVNFKFREKILQWIRKIFKQQQKGQNIKLESVAGS
jgi:hypothetical protein